MILLDLIVMTMALGGGGGGGGEALFTIYQFDLELYFRIAAVSIKFQCLTIIQARHGQGFEDNGFASLQYTHTASLAVSNSACGVLFGIYHNSHRVQAYPSSIPTRNGENDGRPDQRRGKPDQTKPSASSFTH